MPHPNTITKIDLFTKNDMVKFFTIDDEYRDVYARSNLILTDYSSSIFDFVYLRKPIFYTQFDKEDFIKGEHAYVPGYFDYERDGFGPVITDKDKLVDEIIRKNNLAVNDIEFIACCVGPGSFTGIRIGVSSIKAIAEVLNVKLAQVTSLETLAANVENEETIVSLIDARNNQVYCGIFNSNYELIEKYMADDINNIIPIINKYENITYVGDGAITHKELLNINTFESDNVIHASRIGLCAYAKFQNSDTVTADTLSPMYLRPSQAERMKKLNG
jgi:tRNA threonylcarbamoyl adenosine modification protein YeaZ